MYDIFHSEECLWESYVHLHELAACSFLLLSRVSLYEYTNSLFIYSIDDALAIFDLWLLWI